MRDFVQVVHQALHHLGGVGSHVFGVCLRVHHRERALACIVKGARNLKGLHMRFARKPHLLQEVVKAAATGQRGRGQHRRACLAPDKLAQQIAWHDGAGVGAEQQKAVFTFALQPFGQGLLAMLEQQTGRAHQACQARRQRP